jgi:hypothetical protein
MLNSLLQKINNVWTRMSVREQRLASIVGIVVVLSICVTTVRSGWEHIKDLDDTIGNLQQDLINYHGQIAKKKSIEAQYDKVAKQHSSQWTEAEIHDRLRGEIYRLAQKTPPKLNEEGVPVRTTTAEGTIVNIPSLQPGSLDTTAGGYRQYHISFFAPYETLEQILIFLERLMASPQSLRIDVLDLVRGELAQSGSAKIDITRTVVAGAPTDGKDQQEEKTEKQAVSPPAWKCDGGTIEEIAGDTPGKPIGFKGKAAQAEARFYLSQTVTCGETYDLTADLMSAGKCRIAISGESGENEFAGSEALQDDGQLFRYRIQFTVPGENGSKVTLCVPSIVLESAEASAAVYNLLLKKRMR